MYNSIKVNIIDNALSEDIGFGDITSNVCIDEKTFAKAYFLVKEDEETPHGLDVAQVLKKAVPLFDGGFTVGGIVGNGDLWINCLLNTCCGRIAKQNRGDQLRARADTASLCIPFACDITHV